MKVNLTAGSNCIDLAAREALCIRMFQITGGTGRFSNASGSITLTEAVAPVLADVSNNPVFFTTTGEISGTISAVGGGAEDQPDQERR